MTLLCATYLDGYKLVLKFRFNSWIKPYDYFFILASLSLLLINIFDVNTLFRIVLAIVVSSFLPGYTLLRLFRIRYLYSYIEMFILSYALSLPLTGILSTLLILTEEKQRVLILCSIYVSLSVFPLLKDIWNKWKEWVRNEGERICRSSIEITNMLLLSAIFLFFMFSILIIYPSMSYVLNSDIVRHFSSVNVLSRTPDLFSGSYYIFFHLHESTILVLSDTSMTTFQTALACLSVVVILSFYIMAKAYFVRIDKRLPTFSTTFWSLFSGFGWIYFLEKFFQINGNRLYLLNLASEKTYWDIMYGQSSWLWLWYRPISVGFALFFTLIYLWKRTDIERRTYTVIFSLIIVGLGLSHIPELVMYVALSIIARFFISRSKLRIQDSLLSTLLGCTGIIVLFFIFQLAIGISIPSDLYYTILFLIIVTFLTYSTLSFKKTFHIAFQGKILQFAIVLLLTLYFGGIFTWISTEAFSVKYVQDSLFVPWLLYPVLLGITGLLALTSLRFFIRRNNDDITTFVYLLIASLIFGRLISIINMTFFNTGYFERRFIPFVFSAAAIIAPIALLQKKKTISNHHNMRKIYSIILICSIVFAGTTSTFLSLEFWKETISTRRGMLVGDELNAISHLDSLIKENPRSPILTVSDSSKMILEFTSSPYLIDYTRLQLWKSKNPIEPLAIIYNQRYPPPYIYLHGRDKQEIQRNYQNGYLAEHMLSYIPKVYNNSKTEIFKILDGSPPLLNSDVTLITFDHSEGNYLFAFDILSLGKHNYTVMSDLDTTIMDANVIILSSDRTSILINDMVDQPASRSDRKIVILNTDGYGTFSKLFFEDHNESIDKIEATIIQGQKSEVHFPIKLEVAPLTVKEGVEVLSWYADDSMKVPFATVKNGNLIYVNVYPFIKAMLLNEKSARTLYPFLGNLLDCVLDLPKCGGATDWYFGGKIATFKGVLLQGKVMISTPSIVFQKETRIPEMSMGMNNDRALKNITGITINGASDFTIYATEVDVCTGKGFYSRVILKNCDIFVNGCAISISVVSNGNRLNFNEKSETKLSSIKHLDIYVREPHIVVDGETSFNEMYAYFSLSKELDILGKNTTMRGNANFHILVSDTYIIASELTWKGVIKAESNLQPSNWNELTSLLTGFPWLSLSFLFIVAVISIRRIRKIKRVNGNN